MSQPVRVSGFYPGTSFLDLNLKNTSVFSFKRERSGGV